MNYKQEQTIVSSSQKTKDRMKKTPLPGQRTFEETLGLTGTISDSCHGGTVSVLTAFIEQKERLSSQDRNSKLKEGNQWSERNRSH